VRIAGEAAASQNFIGMVSPSILLVIERETPSQLCLGRALMMARYLRARLDLLLCPDRLGQALNLAWSHKELAEARDYLEAMRNSIVAPDVEIRTEIAAAGVRHTDIIAHARRSGCQMIIKRPWHPQPLLRERTDWNLLHESPVPLLLTEGRPWHPRPRFLAAIDPLAGGGAAAAILGAAADMRSACSANLDLLYVQAAAPAGAPTEGEAPAEVELDRLARQHQIPPGHVHVLAGGDIERIARFVTDGGYDLLVIGAPVERSMDSIPHSDSLDQALMRLDCDLLVLHRAAIPGAARGASVRWGMAPFWHSIGID
jgi:nucleotide-binding universal stress UspA family protein